MIVLFNLNKYVGGGETLLIRLAQYLQDKEIPYQILTSGGACWILEESKKLGLNYYVWPAHNDSINYQTQKERNSLVEKMTSAYANCEDLRVFTFCMRDIHNALYVFTRIQHCKVVFAHGIYHPEDVYYLASLSSRRKEYIQFNKRIITELYNSKSVLFVNNNGLKTSLSSLESAQTEILSDAIIIPIPIPIPKPIPIRKLDLNRPLRIVCISRFVEFKVGAVLAIMRYAAIRENIDLIVIGHGPLKLILKVWMFVNQVKNIKIISGVEPDRLDSYIDTCDIGYAQGTSILEIAKRGLPVLIAPYSRKRDLFNTKFPTLGIFGEISDYSVFGDIKELHGLNTLQISDAIDMVSNDYKYYQQKTVKYIERFSTDIVCKNIYNFIKVAEYSNQGWTFHLLRAPSIKKYIKKLLK